MRLDGALTDAKRQGDLLAALSLRGETQGTHPRK